MDAIGRMEGRPVILDIKTGVRPPTPGFAQLGLYALVMQELPDLPSPAAAGIIWAPRRRPSSGSVVWRDAPALMDHARKVVRELARVALEGGVARPCDRCYTCPVEGCIFGEKE